MAFRPPIALTGRWISLEPISLELAPALRAAGNAPEIWTYFRAGDLRGPGRMEGHLQQFLERQAAGTDVPFVVRERRLGRPIGMTAFLAIQREDRSVEIGSTWYDRSCWGTSVNPEAKLLLLGHAFEAEGVHRVQLKCDERNARSARAIERLGARYEGSLREHLRRPDGSYRSSRFYSVLASEWPPVRARLEGHLRAFPAPPSDDPGPRRGSE